MLPATPPSQMQENQIAPYCNAPMRKPAIKARRVDGDQQQQQSRAVRRISFEHVRGKEAPTTPV